MSENEKRIPTDDRPPLPERSGADRLKDHELATLMLDALRHAEPDALFVGGYEKDFYRMLVLIDGNFEMIRAARYLRDALEKAVRSQP